jgi:hypothetical protein
MKILAGIILAGVLAGGSALLFGAPAGGPRPSATPPPPASPGGPPKKEHVACIDAHGSLDGPAKEAIGYGWQMSGAGFPDAEGNLWGGDRGTRWLRASDGRIMAISSCEYGSFSFDCGKEGPIIGRPPANAPGGDGWPCGGSAIVGRPDSGGKADGIYQSLGLDGRIIRIWKNKEKGGRWWFEIVAGGGGAAAPRARGQSAEALGVKFKWINMPQVGLDGKMRFMADNAMYLLDEGKVTCILSPDDYKPATEVMKGLPNECYAGGDGSFYLGYYYSGEGAYGGKAPGIWRVKPDGKVEPCCKSSRGNKTTDGDALTESGWFCGPHIGRGSGYRACRYIPADSMFTSAHDEDLFRRLQNGRMATLCQDGEWREISNPGQGLTLGEIGPNGTVYFSLRRWVDMRLYRYTGLDFKKPVAGKANGGGK